MAKPGPHTIVDVLTGKAELGVLRHLTGKDKKTDLAKQLQQYGVDPTVARQYARAANRIQDSKARTAFEQNAISTALNTYTTNLPSLGAKDQSSALGQQVNDYINQVLGPAPQPLDPLAVQSMLGSVWKPLYQQDQANLNFAANAARNAGIPDIANQYLGMAGHVANAYQQQALAFPQAYALTQSLDRANQVQQTRNSIASNLAGQGLGGGSNTGSISDQLFSSGP